MKKNKKLFAVLAALAMGMSLSLTGCSSESSGGGSSGVSGKPGAASLLEFTEGTVIRNKVVNLDSDAVLYEYLKFTSPTEGEYSLYSYDEKTGFTKETTVDSISVPASFIYNAEDGSFKTEFGGNANYTYMFKTVENKVEKFYIAMNILYNGSEKPSLFDLWEIPNGASYNFKKDGTVVVVDLDENKFVYDYTNTNGLVMVDELPMFWADVTGKPVFYYSAFETESSEVEDAGRSAAVSAGYDFASSKSILGIF